MSDPFKSLLAASGLLLVASPVTDTQLSEARYQIARVMRDRPEGEMEVHELALVHAVQVFLSIHRNSARVHDFLSAAMALFAEARRVEPKPQWWVDL